MVQICSKWQLLLGFFLCSHLKHTEGSEPASTTAQASCVQSPAVPIQIPIRNITVGDGTLPRGIAISIGTPFQALAFDLAPFVPFNMRLFRA